MSYTIEVYRRRQPAERHLGIYALYVMFFPQLVAGPIVRARELLGQTPAPRACRAADAEVAGRRGADLPASELANLIQELTGQMHQAAGDLHFELAARLRDEISDLKKELRQMSAAT